MAVCEEDETGRAESAEQDHAGRGTALVGGGGQAHGIGLRLAGGGRLVKPAAELRDRVAVHVGFPELAAVGHEKCAKKVPLRLPRRRPVTEVIASGTNSSYTSFATDQAPWRKFL